MLYRGEQVRLIEAPPEVQGKRESNSNSENSENEGESRSPGGVTLRTREGGVKVPTEKLRVTFTREAGLGEGRWIADAIERYDSKQDVWTEQSGRDEIHEAERTFGPHMESGPDEIHEAVKANREAVRDVGSRQDEITRATGELNREVTRASSSTRNGGDAWSQLQALEGEYERIKEREDERIKFKSLANRVSDLEQEMRAMRRREGILLARVYQLEASEYC